jgi:prevent-host-death family protein
LTMVVKFGYRWSMTRTNVAELKSHLSGYLRMVRRGESVLVCERNRPVARIVPVGNEELDPRERAIEIGVLEPRSGTRGGLPRVKPIPSRGGVVEAVLAGRRER